MTNIGVFDSGLGGLTVLSELIKYKKANYFYLGDSKRAPYGNRDKDEIIGFSYEIVDFLEQYDIDQYVIACNTISTIGVDKLEQKYQKKFYPITKFGIENACKFDGDFLVLGTKATMRSHFYKNNIEAINKCHVDEVAAIKLVDLIEKGQTSGVELDNYLSEYLSLANEKNIPNILLACTHYPLIESEIKKNLTYPANIINPASDIGKKIGIDQEENLVINIFMTEISKESEKIIDSLVSENYNLELKEI